MPDDTGNETFKVTAPLKGLYFIILEEPTYTKLALNRSARFTAPGTFGLP